MVRWAKLNIRRGTIPSLDEVDEARTSVFFEKIRATLDAKQFKPHDRMIDRLLDQGYASTDICSALIHMLQGSPATADKKPPAGAPSARAAKPAIERPAAEAAATASVQSAPGWAKSVATPKKAVYPTPSKTPALGPAQSADRAATVEDEQSPTLSKKQKYERPARTGREPGMVTIFLNVGRKQLITPADIVGKISGVTRLPANVVGAIDIHQRHTLVDVAADQLDFVLKKLVGIKIKGISLEPARAGAENQLADDE
jgi:ATP-dependent RNA helicase DeaD